MNRGKMRDKRDGSNVVKLRKTGINPVSDVEVVFTYEGHSFFEKIPKKGLTYTKKSAAAFIACLR